MVLSPEARGPNSPDGAIEATCPRPVTCTPVQCEPLIDPLSAPAQRSAAALTVRAT